MDLEESLVECLWIECAVRVKRGLKWRSRADVREAVQAVRVRHVVEWFCGTGALSAACSQLGLLVSWYDCKLDPIKMSLLTDVGMAKAILLSLSLVVGGTAWFGVPCSTFVFVSRGHTKRSRMKPKGNVQRKDIRQANLIVERVVFLIKILAKRKVYWIMEQRLNSLLWYMSAIKKARRDYQVNDLKWQRSFLWMGHYGHSLSKPTELVGVFPGLDTAWPTQRPPKSYASAAYRQWHDKQGRKRVAGKAGLKATEHYPAEFCRVTAQLVKQNLQLKPTRVLGSIAAAYGVDVAEARDENGEDGSGTLLAQVVIALLLVLLTCTFWCWLRCAKQTTERGMQTEDEVQTTEAGDTKEAEGRAKRSWLEGLSSAQLEGLIKFSGYEIYSSRMVKSLMVQIIMQTDNHTLSELVESVEGQVKKKYP